MKICIKQIAKLLTLSIGLLAVMLPTVNAHAHDNLEIVTALLRGPAAYLEYELRNDTSRNAHAQKALIAAVRLVNDLNSPTSQLKHHAFGWFVYDAKEIFVHLKALLVRQKQLAHSTQTPSEQKLSGDKDYQFFRRFVLPMLEMLSAFGRTEFVRSKLPHRGGCFAGSATTMSRLSQLYCAAPQNSKNRKILQTLLVCCFVEILIEMRRIYVDIHADQQEAVERQRAAQAAAQRIRIINKNERSDSRPIVRYTQDSEGNNECSVCLDKPKEPHALNCGHVFCKQCICSCLDNKLKCPYCNQNVPKTLYEI